MSRIIERAQEKIEEDYTEIVKTFLKKGKMDLINSAYELAHYNEIVDFFDCIDEECPPFEDEVFENIANCEQNAIVKVWQTWLDYRHPERYNFFCYEDLSDIISEAFR